MGTVWGLLKMLLELWEALKTFIGMVEKAKHEKAQEEIKEETGIIADPNKSEQEKHEATKNLEDQINGRA